MRSAEQKALHMWLAERALDDALANGDITDTPPPTDPADVQGDALAMGQIRLLIPSLTPGSTPRYAAACDTGDDAFALIPFSRYAGPALPGECTTSLTAPPLRVACLWNVIAVDADRARQKSWLAGVLGPDVASALSNASRAFHAGRAPGHHEDRTLGPRLVHPRDPRHAYIAEEQELATAVREGCGVRADTPTALYQMSGADVGDRIAAEAPSPYGHVRHASIAGTVLRLTWDIRPGQDLVQIEAESGEISEHFDGCWLRNPDGDCSCPAWNGQMQVPAPLIETADCIVRPEGTLYRLLRAQ